MSRRPAQARETERGMTLIEVMVAIAIVAILGTMIWSAFSQTATNRRIIESAQDRYHAAAIAMDRIARDLQSAFLSTNFSPLHPVTATAFVGRDRPPLDRVDFTTFSHRRLVRNAHESDQAEVAYFGAPDAHVRDQMNLVRRESRRIDDDPLHGGSVMVLIEDVTLFDLHYYDSSQNLWLEYWDTTQATEGQPLRLPLFVKVALGFRDEHGREVKLLEQVDVQINTTLFF